MWPAQTPHELAAVHGRWKVLLCLSLLVPWTTPAPGQASFRRGDSNQDGTLDLSDTSALFGFLFGGLERPSCLDALDSNDDGALDLSDGLFSLNFLFLGGAFLPSPGSSLCGPDPTEDSLSCEAYPEEACPRIREPQRQLGHVLNRVAYGPAPVDVEAIEISGLPAYLQEQLAPESALDLDNIELTAREAELFRPKTPARDLALITAGEPWRYAKGTSPPPANWLRTEFDDSNWLVGLTGIGYGDGDDATILEDMQGNYVSVLLA